MLTSCKARSNQENLKQLDAIRFIFTVSAEKRPSADDDEDFPSISTRGATVLMALCAVFASAVGLLRDEHENMKMRYTSAYNKKNSGPKEHL